MKTISNMIESLSDLKTYEPAGHSGTTNARLVEAAVNGLFELVHGTMEPNGDAEWHSHEDAFQAIYVTSGRAKVELEGQDTQICGPDTIIRIPKGIGHAVTSIGPDPLKMILVYSPPISAVTTNQSV